MDEVIKAVQITPLKKIFHPKGDILHAMKQSSPGYAGFGEAYFTTINIGEFKGWKKHTQMQMNLIVPVGKVRFYVYDESISQTTHYEIGSENYVRLTVPAGYWMAFTGLGRDLNLILNLASIEHNPVEAINVPLETYPLDMTE